MKTRIVVVAALCIAGCSGIESTRAPQSAAQLGAGLSYFLPMRDIKVTYKAPNGTPAVHTITVAPGSSYPDLAQHYLLRLERNEVGVSQMNFTITPHGLLTSAVSDVDSKLDEVFVDAAKSAGAMVAAVDAGDIPPAPAPAPLDRPCLPGQEYVALFSPSAEQLKNTVRICGSVYAHYKRSGAPLPAHGKDATGTDKTGTDDPTNGIYYRQDQPFSVSVSTCDGNCASAESHSILHTAVVGVPNLSPTYFLPINKTLFGKNVATITLNDGVVTGYRQNFDGEALAIAKIPFAAVSAFFSGVGDIFDKRKTAAANEAAFRTELAKLTARQFKTELCLAAFRAKDDKAITEYCS